MLTEPATASIAIVSVLEAEGPGLVRVPRVGTRLVWLTGKAASL